MDTLSLKSLLADIPIADIQYIPVTGSTNADAIEWAQNGAPDFSLIAADEQTTGRGRFDRRWVTNPNSALAFSLILCPNQLEREKISLFSPLAGIAVCSALESITQIPAQIKWPNDVLINQLKVCGILAESVWSGTELAALVVGIGVNITKYSVPSEQMLTYPAGSVEGTTSQIIDRWQLLHQVLTQFNYWRTQLGSEHFFRYWQKHLAFTGQAVSISGTAGPEITGRLVGINHAGELIVETLAGTQTIQVGDVRLRLRAV